MMNLDKVSLDKEIILNATEEIIRRFGPDKANISDVAKSLKVSHAAIYRYFNGKTDLWNAVTERWLTRLHASSIDILKEDSPSDIKLCHLLQEFVEANFLQNLHIWRQNPYILQPAFLYIQTLSKILTESKI